MTSEIVDISSSKGRRNNLLAISSFLLFILLSCSPGKTGIENKVFLKIYCDFSDRLTLRIDDEIIYDEKGTRSAQGVEFSLGPYTFDGADAEIFFRVDDKDTLFSRPLKKNNYWSIGYSKWRHEFQFTSSSDSVHYFNSRID